MLRLLFAITLTFILSIVAYTSVAAIGEEYDYYCTITVNNDSGGSFSNLRISAPIPVGPLISGNFIQDNGDDTIIYRSSTQYPHLVRDLSASGTTSWPFGFIDINSEEVQSYKFYFGNATATRSQSWLSSPIDNCYAEHDASLSFNSGSSFAINCDVTLVGTPVGECFVAGKSGSYELLVEDTPEFVFRVYEVGTSTISQNLVPNQYISNTADISGGSLPDLLTDSSDSSYIHDYIDTSITIVGLSNPTLPESLNVGTITVYVRGKEGTGGGASTVEPALGYTSYQSGSEMALTTSWAWHTEIFPTDPDGNAWDVDDMHNLRLKLTINGIPTVLVSEAYVMVEGTYSGSPTSVSIPATIGTETHLTGYYINGNIGISDGSNTSSGTVSSLNTNTSKIRISEFNGYLDNVKVSVP